VKNVKTIIAGIAGTPARAFTSGIGLVAATIAFSGYGLPMAYGLMALAICCVTGFVVAAFLFIIASICGATDPEYSLNANAQEGKDQP